MNYSDIKKVTEETDIQVVQKYLDTGHWYILSVAPGHREDGTAYHLYALGLCNSIQEEFNDPWDSVT